MSTDTREPRIRAAVPCPTCGALIGQPCRQGTAPHDARRGAEDLREILHRAHQDRRAAWQQQRGPAPPGPPVPTSCPMCGVPCSSRTKAKIHCGVTR